MTTGFKNSGQHVLRTGDQRITDRGCGKCGATVTDPDASFCSRCGSSLLQGTTNTQSIRHNSGNALNVSVGSGVLSGGIHLNNSMANPYQLPPIDLSPSRLLGGKITTREQIRIFSITGVIAVISGLFTIFGINIFDLKKYFPFSMLMEKNIYWSVIVFIAGIICFSCAMLIQALIVRRVTFFRFIRTAWVNIADRIYVVHFKRVCPYSHCRGIMDPQREMISKEGKNKFVWMWICERNRDLHKVEYDSTQVDRAISDGGLASLFQKSPP